ncbi:MAG: matrixin family metalloprotease [Chthoniobacterales bacterium]
MQTGFRRLVCLLGAGMFFVARAAHGYSASGEHWTIDRNVVMHLSLGGPHFLQDGFPSFNESAADALQTWNGYLAHMQFVPRVNSPLPPADGDSDNSAFFSSTVYGKAFGKNVLAVTLLSTRGANIFIEGDTIFNTAITWDSYRGPLQGNTLDFHRVALHEFGHTVGLDHPDEASPAQHVTAIMNSLISNIDSLQSDDITGGQSLYNTGPAYRTIPPAPNLVNLSTRGFVGVNDQVLIGGFILDGSQSTTVILRAIGHSLAGFGISSPLKDPQIELRDGNGTLLSTNDDWIDSPDAQTIASYKLDPGNTIESAIMRTLTPGNYTALVRSFDNGDGDLTGTGLVELYDLHANTGGRAQNISTRGQVQTGDDVMIAGFIVGGTQPKEVVVRGIGPSLLDSNVPGALLDPTIEVHSASGQTIASNDNWQTDPGATRVMTLNLAPKRNAESAIDLTLNPGTYTAIMRGVNNSTGIGLIEVYDISPAP